MYFKRILIAAGLLLLFISACSTQEKLAAIRRGEVSPSFRLPADTAFVPQIKRAAQARDTITVQMDGKELIIMKAYSTDDGLVATEQLDAAYVTAKSRNVAVRNGKVNVTFQIVVPESMLDEHWQLRFYPLAYIQEDTLGLNPVHITGERYRRTQLRGYEQYERFLRRIIPDSTVTIERKNLEIFLERNIPQVFALKRDSTMVSDSVFRSIYGVSEQQAVEHYTHIRRATARQKEESRRRLAQREEMFRRRVRLPIASEGIKLDTMVVDDNGAFVYTYSQVLDTRPGLRKADITLAGDIYLGEKCLYSMPESAPITFYISSLSAFTEPIVRYKKMVVERRVGANQRYNVEFELGKSTVRRDLADNERELGMIEKNLRHLVFNEVFDLDSIVVEAHASPEGTVQNNARLSEQRSKSIANYVQQYLRSLRDSVQYIMDENGKMTAAPISQSPVKLSTHWSGENWEELDRLVAEDNHMSEEEKADYFSRVSIPNPDRRERSMYWKGYYHYLIDSLYPKLRSVDFNFHMHRKDMVKDTVHTTVVDDVYEEGLNALREMDYPKALEILSPYKDINTAIAYSALDRNLSALSILEKEEDRAVVNYLLA